MPCASTAAAVRPQWGVVRCWQCQGINEASAETCTACGATLPPPGQIPPSYWTAPARMPMPASADAGVSSLIPYRNVPALVGYYLAIFSLVPCLGLLLGIPAVVLGILGILRAQQHPLARGKVHARFAVIFGAVCVLGQVIAVVVLMTHPDIL